VLRRFGGVVAVVVMVVVGSPAVAAGGFTPAQGVRFNNPTADRAAQDRTMVYVRQSIDAAPKNSIIRIAAYSFDRRDIADALVRACTRRHVTVQIVLNDNWISGSTKRLRRLMGTNLKPHWQDACHPREKPTKPNSTKTPYPDPSFVKICVAACRMGGEYGNQHMKFYLFSQSGLASNVVMFGSTNLTYFAARVHWNDLFTVSGKPQMFKDYSKIFAQLVADKRVEHPYWKVTHGDLVSEFGAKRNATGSRDPIMQRLAQVGCTAKAGYGVGGRTVIRISMYGWRGSRGEYLARRVADLSRQGCRISALVSGASGPVLKSLRAGGVALRSASLDTDEDPETGFEETGWEYFTHEKWMSLNGTWAGKGTRTVWTGSENWSRVSFLNDELTVMIPRPRIHDAYVAHFNYIWTYQSKPI